MATATKLSAPASLAVLVIACGGATSEAATREAKPTLVTELPTVFNGAKFVVDRGDVFLNESVTITRVPADGGQATIIAQNTNGPMDGFAVDDRRVYYGNGDGLTNAYERADGSTTSIGANDQNMDCVISNDKLFTVGCGTGIGIQPLLGGDAALLPFTANDPADAPACPFRIEISGSSLVLDDSKRMYTVDPNSGQSHSLGPSGLLSADDRFVYSRELPTPSPNLLVTNVATATVVRKLSPRAGHEIIDAAPGLGELYYAEDDALFRVAMPDGNPELVLGGLKSVTGVALGDDAVYWIQEGTRLMKLRR